MARAKTAGPTLLTRKIGSASGLQAQPRWKHDARRGVHVHAGGHVDVELTLSHATLDRRSRSRASLAVGGGIVIKAVLRKAGAGVGRQRPRVADAVVDFILLV